MFLSSKKTLILSAIIYFCSIATIKAQTLIPNDMISQLIYKMAFSNVPQSEFNKAYQNFVKTTYPERNGFYEFELEEVSSSFALYLVSSKTADAWKKYNSTNQAPSAAFKVTHRLTADLNVFSKQDGGSTVVTSLKKGNTVQILEYGEYASWNGITAKWAKVQTTDNKTGWLFSGYLEEVK